MGAVSARAGRVRNALLGLAILGLVSGCGASGPASPDAPSAQPAPASSTAAAADELVITVQDGAGSTQTWRLSCNPPGGTHPDPTAACAALSANGAKALPAVPKGKMCSQLYGGPQTATITGTWQGRPVRSAFSRVNGCETSRWDSLAGLLPKPGS